MSEFEKKVVGVRSVDASDSSSLSVCSQPDSYRDAWFLKRASSDKRPEDIGILRALTLSRKHFAFLWLWLRLCVIVRAEAIPASC